MMKKEHSKKEIFSCALALFPPLVFLALGLAISLNPDLQWTKCEQALWVITILGTSIIGFVLGIISLFKKPKRYLLPIIGTILNIGWIIFLIWAFGWMIDSWDKM